VVALTPLVQIKANLHYLNPERRCNGTMVVTASAALLSNRTAFETVRGRWQSRGGGRVKGGGRGNSHGTQSSRALMIRARKMQFKKFLPAICTYTGRFERSQAQTTIYV
jgi:hypothetical protein